MAGFYEPTGPQRHPVYNSASRKIGYMNGDWFTRVDGTPVARITKYHQEPPAPTQSCSGSVVINPDPTYEG